MPFGAIAATNTSPQGGTNAVSGLWLEEAMICAQMVIDLAHSLSFDDKAVLELFQTSGCNLLAAEVAAEVAHLLTLSIVAVDPTDIGYFGAQVAQEKPILVSGIPYTDVRSTQFMEFLGGIAD